MKQGCFVCGRDDFKQVTEAYRKCLHCGHETLIASNGQSFMLNDPLSVNEVVRVTSLDRFKNMVLYRFDPSPPKGGVWVDVGSASGKYLFQNMKRYSKVIGLEVTQSAIEFSRKVLKLNVLENTESLPDKIHIITAWHSLEHLPINELASALDSFSKKMSLGARFVVSVPNSNSIQYGWFRSSYAFFDVPNHLHQFTPKSLDSLLAEHGFNRVKLIVSWPYNIFGFVQGFLNILTGTHNYLYMRLKRKSIEPSWWKDILHFFLLMVAVPFGCAMGLVDAIVIERQGVITVCYEKCR